MLVAIGTWHRKILAVGWRLRQRGLLKTRLRFKKALDINTHIHIYIYVYIYICIYIYVYIYMFISHVYISIHIYITYTYIYIYILFYISYMYIMYSDINTMEWHMHNNDVWVAAMYDHVARTVKLNCDYLRRCPFSKCLNTCHIAILLVGSQGFCQSNPFTTK